MAQRPLKPDQKISLIGSCLICHEIEICPHDDQAWEIQNACPECHREIESFLSQPNTTVHSETEGSIRDANRLFQKAKLPLICGLTDQSLETQRAAIQLAERADAAIDWTHNSAPFAMHRAIQETGFVTCTYGEIRDRADLIIHWSTNITAKHAPFLKRFTTGKPVLTVNGERAAQIETLQFLRSGNCDTPINPERSVLADTINAAAYPVILIDDEDLKRLGDDGVLSLLRFVRQQNDRNHCRLVHLSSQSNSHGIKSALTSATGGPYGITFREGEPLYRGSEFAVPTLLATHAADLLVLIGSPRQIDCKIIPESLPTIWICDQHDAQSASELPAHLLIPTARWGLEIKGTGIRGDGVPIDRPPLFASDGLDPAIALSRLMVTNHSLSDESP